MTVSAQFNLSNSMYPSSNLYDVFDYKNLPTLNPPDGSAPSIELRAINAADLISWFEYLTQEEIRQYTSWNVTSPADLQQFIRRPDWSDPSAQIKFAIANKQNDQLIGTIGFHTISQANQSAEIAYDLNPVFWGQGIATTACQVLTCWAHQHAHFQRIQATVLDNNIKSRRVLEKCGFSLEGHLKKYRKVRGQARDYWMFSHVT